MPWPPRPCQPSLTCEHPEFAAHYAEQLKRLVEHLGDVPAP
ncbi:hypothetical protein [Nonomuraea sp. LPB2021202275-12-8]